MLTRPGRTASISGIAMGIALLAAPRAVAADSTTPVTCTADSCTVSVSSPGQGGGSGGSPGNGGGSSPIGSGQGQGAASSTSSGSSNPANVTFSGGRFGTRGVAPPAAAPPAAPPAPAAPAPPAPAVLAQQAVSQLQLPSPTIHTSPSGDQVVFVPTWLWIDPGAWAPVSATAAVPGESVTATATPQSVTWSMGDGGTTTCFGPGTPYNPAAGSAMSPSPDCGYTYSRASFGVPSERFSVTATITWSVTWAGGGQAGAVPGLATTTGAALRVTEVQTIVIA